MLYIDDVLSSSFYEKFLGRANRSSRFCSLLHLVDLLFSALFYSILYCSVPFCSILTGRC